MPADPAVISEMQSLSAAAYQASVGAWIQIDPSQGLTTVLNAFNTLSPMDLEVHIFQRDGTRVAKSTHRIETFHSLRLDLESVIDAASLPVEGSLWTWSRGTVCPPAPLPCENLSFQAIDLDFIDRSRPEGYVLGSVHTITDFGNTLAMGPYIDLVGSRLMVERTPEGGQRYQNFLGLSFAPTSILLGNTLTDTGQMLITVRNSAGETLRAAAPVPLGPLQSWFGDLSQLIPGLADFLIPPGAQRGFGTVTVTEQADRAVGITGMVKVVDTLTGEMLVCHLNDRNFSRPAQKSVS